MNQPHYTPLVASFQVLLLFGSVNFRGAATSNDLVMIPNPRDTARVDASGGSH